MAASLPSDSWPSADALRDLVGMPITDPPIYRQALTHRSVLRGHQNSQYPSYERLEYLGDALLDFIVAEELYHRFPEKNEGFLTRLRAKLVSKPSLAQYARSMEVGPWIRMTKNAEQAGARDNPNILADAFEALLAAVYLDRGHNAARRFVKKRALEAIDLEDVATRERNFKSLLQEHLHATGQPLPMYHVVDERGPSHAKVYSIEVQIDGSTYGAGTARSKKRAEQQAAAEALDALRDETAVRNN